MLILPGSNALSAFRSQRLLTQLQAVLPAITAVQARHLHFIDAATPLSSDDTRRLQGLLTYGEPAQAELADGGAVEEFVVIPRFGTISPWASKATDIVHNCGMAHIKRLERGVAYRVHLKAGFLGSSIGAGKMSAEQAEAVAALLHDRMTDSVLRHADEAAGLFRTLEAKPLEAIDVLQPTVTAPPEHDHPDLQ
eukprot:gene31496-38901_t